jgi:hypothetical protein
VCGYVFWSVEAELLFVGPSFLYLGEFTCSWAYISVGAALFPCGSRFLAVGGPSALAVQVLELLGPSYGPLEADFA